MPADVTMRSRMGLYAARIGDKSTAAENTKRAIAAAPENGDVRFRAAMVYELGGDRANALAELSNATKYGYPAHLIAAEPDLVALRRDPRYNPPTSEGVK